MKKKFRYMMSGMFTGTDGNRYDIEIPSPIIYENKKDAMRDGSFGYRFILNDTTNEPVICIFSRERHRKADIRSIFTWVEGDIVGIYTYEQFKALGGTMRILKLEKIHSAIIDATTDFLDTDKAFKDVFPDMEPMELYYIDAEAYRVIETDVL